MLTVIIPFQFNVYSGSGPPDLESFGVITKDPQIHRDVFCQPTNAKSSIKLMWESLQTFLF